MQQGYLRDVSETVVDVREIFEGKGRVSKRISEGFKDEKYVIEVKRDLIIAETIK